jgi:hypothetical protein
MKAALAILSLVVLAGCASAPEQVVDQDAVVRAERSAQLGWAQIYWVNMPTKVKSADTAKN